MKTNCYFELDLFSELIELVHKNGQNDLFGRRTNKPICLLDKMNLSNNICLRCRFYFATKPLVALKIS